LNLVDITGTCGFSDPSSQTFCVTWLDYDQDGFLDLCVSHRTMYLIGHIKLYHNLGNDTFSDVTVSAGLSGLGNSVLAMTSLDYNNDGLIDIYVGQDYDQGNILLKNNGDGTFDNVSAESNTNVMNDTMSATIGDYDSDGDFDIYVTNTASGNTLLNNQGDGTFVNVTVAMGVQLNKFTWGASFLDVDADMDLDLHVNGASSNPHSSHMFLNPGDGSAFVNSSVAMGFGTDLNYCVGLAVGDYNSDGRPDLAKNNSGGTINTFWRNDFDQNHYLSIDLSAQVSNKFAVGAVVEVIVGNVHQMQYLACGESFSSQNSHTLFFGLGTSEMADEIIVRWPNGLITHTYNVGADQRITLYEITEGCTDPLACNYNSSANQENGSCEFAVEYYTCEGICLNDLDGDAVCDQLEIPGCTDPLACNYSEDATDENGSCTYPETYYDCDGNCIQDTDDDGICDQQEIPGCTDATACNFSEEATDNDNSCTYPEDYYNCDGLCVSDIDSDGVCDELEIAGCQDETACNYDPIATDPGNCEYVELYAIEGSNLVWSPDETYTFVYPFTEGSTYLWSTLLSTAITGQGSNEVDIQWYEEGDEVLTVVEITANGCVGDSVHVELLVLFASVAENDQAPFVIYPNPADDELNLVYESITGSFEFQILNPMGQVVKKGAILQSPQHIDVIGLSSGIYQVVLFNDLTRFSKTLEIR
jgi:hypothetical protein